MEPTAPKRPRRLQSAKPKQPEVEAAAAAFKSGNPDFFVDLDPPAKDRNLRVPMMRIVSSEEEEEEEAAWWRD